MTYNVSSGTLNPTILYHANEGAAADVVMSFTGVCENVAGTFRCLCRGRMKGIRCELRDFCDSGPCQHGSRCTDTITGPVCDCPSGYKG